MDPSLELYSRLLKWLMGSSEREVLQYLSTDYYSVSVEMKRDSTKWWIEIKEFLVHEPYRHQGYGKQLAKRLLDSEMNMKIISVLSPVLTRILRNYGWTQIPNSYDWTNH
jgi:GNAT superfamily N-acetyltransferase